MTTDPSPTADPTPYRVPGLRPVRDTDADAVTALVGAAYAEHPGCVLDLPGVDADLTAPASAAARAGGRWWVVERQQRVVASVGLGAVRADGTGELKRLYLDQQVRGRGLASSLVRFVERTARQAGAARVDLWSDTRFTRAHHRYQVLGYRRTGEQRQLDDPSSTTEYRFVRELSG